MDAIFRLVGAVGAILSLAALGLAVWFSRREVPVRPGRDALRISIALGTVVFMIVVLSAPAPWLLSGGLALAGGALGLLQGRGLEVRDVGGRLMARRSIPALAAWGAGVLIMQGAGVAGRGGAVEVGQSVSFFSLGLMVGLVIGRVTPVSRARTRAPSGRMALLMVAAIGLTLSLPATVEAQNEGMTSEQATEFWTQRVDWSRAEMIGGYQSRNKPRIPVVVSPMLADIPEPHGQTVSFTDGQGNAWELAETYTFRPRDNGRCCYLDYAFDATETLEDGTVHEYHGEALELAFGPVLRLAKSHPPFGQELMYLTPDGGAACARAIAETSFRNEYTTFTVDGEEQAGPVISNPEIIVPCDAVGGFTVDAALAALPPVPPADAPERLQSGASGCPVFQEMFTSLWDPQMADAERLTLGTLFVDPNSAACEAGVNLGRELPGEPKIRATWSFSGLESDAENLADFEDRVAGYTESKQRDSYNECPTDDDGLPIYDEAGTCDLIVITEQPETSDVIRGFAQGGTRRIIIHYDSAVEDGPNVTIEVHDSSGTYGFYFHHYEPRDPLIRQVVGNLQRQLGRGIGGFGGQAPAAPAEPAPDQPVSDETETAPSLSADEAADEDGEPEAAPAPGDEQTGEDEDVTPAAAAGAGLIGLVGAALLLGQTLVEAGVPLSRVMAVWRESGIEGLRGLAAETEALDGPPPPPPPPPLGATDQAMATSAELDDALAGVPDTERAAVQAELIGELDTEAVRRAADAARAAVGEIPAGDLGEVLERPEVREALEGLTEDQRQRAVADLIERLGAERREAALGEAREALDIPVSEEAGPLAGQPRGDIGELVQGDDAARDALDRRLPPDESRAAESQLVEELEEARRQQAAREAMEAMERAAAARDIRNALDAGDARTVREILDGLDPDTAAEIWQDVQGGRPPIDLDAMEAQQSPELTTRSPLTGEPQGDVLDAVNRNDQVREVLDRLSEEDRDEVRSRVAEEIAGRRGARVAAAAVEAARREALVASVRAAAEASDPEAINDLLDGLDPAARNEILEAATGHLEGFDPDAIPPAPPGGAPLPDPEIGIDVEGALRRPDLSDLFDELPPDEAEAARAAARAELEAIRREAILQRAREAVEPPSGEAPWQDPHEAAHSDEVARALDEAQVPEDEIGSIQDELAERLQQEQRERLLEEARSALARDRAVEALTRARQAGDAAEVDRILSELSDADREAVLRRLE